MPILFLVFSLHCIGNFRSAEAANPKAASKHSPSDVKLEPTTQPSIDFNRDIRPLLTSRCVLCHGPDEDERAAGLRLDTRDGAIEDLGGYSAAVPGDSSASELLARLTTDDEDARMPPAEKGERFSQSEVELIRRWIDEGAKFAEHWSYQSPSQAQPPSVVNALWCRSPMDRFVLAPLEAAGARVSEDADRLAISRRVAIDLTGLPPDWNDVDAFRHDTRPGAYERFVDRLLASPAFGERWARVWLDLARYADSAGYADDPLRTIWAYRDYVVNSLNEGKPFDQFTIEQIAGDLLPNATEQQIIATAMHRNTLTNSEGGTNDEEFRNVAIVDRVNTTLAVWMGTTVACAQCHTHKYDPITHAEYFQLFDIFNQSADTDKKDERPLLEIWDDELLERKATLQTQIAELDVQLLQMSPELATQRDQWIEKMREPIAWSESRVVSVRAKHRELTVGKDGWVRGDDNRPNKERYTVTLDVPAGTVSALALHVDEKQVDNFVLSQINATYRDHTEQADNEQADNEPVKSRPSDKKPDDKTSASREVAVTFAKAHADYSQSGFLAASAIAKKIDANKGWAIAGQTGKPHQLTLVLSKPIVSQGGQLIVELIQESKYGNHVLDHFRFSTTNQDTQAVSDWATLSAAVQKILHSDRKEFNTKQLEELTEQFRKVAPALRPLQEQRDRLAKQLEGLKPTTTVPVMEEMPAEKRRETHVQIRGNYQSHGEKVIAGTPAAFHPLRRVDESSRNPNRFDAANWSEPPPDWRGDRLALAHWLVASDNPLTARVIANRHWEELFGIGLVPSSEEFGSQGDPPSHPELLDWMAVDLQTNGWDLKRLLREMVTTSTYRQTSLASTQQFADDPDNRQLARGPRFRVSAEMVRDLSLSVAGLLSTKLNGPPVNPPQPNLGLKAAFGSQTDWTTSAGEDRYRRGLYTAWRRSSPYPSMATFDAPNRETCTLRRGRTNTPLQALVTLNDPVFVEAAQGLARRVLESGSKRLDRVGFAYRCCFSREPNASEVARIGELVDAAKQRFNESPESAKAWLADADKNNLAFNQQANLDTIELAAWTLAGNVLLNLDEFFLKR